MRKYVAAVAMALTAFAGQALASGAIASVQSSALTLTSSDRASGEGDEQFLMGLGLLPSVFVVVAALATIAAVTEEDDEPASR